MFDCVTDPVHANVYGVVPPLAVTLALPLLLVLQLSSISVVTDNVNKFGSVTWNEPLAEHPFASVTV